MKPKKRFEAWMVLELMGHRKVAGYVSEESIFGGTMARIDIPTKVGKHGMEFITQYYGISSIYCATPILESDAINLARTYRPRPFEKYDLHRESLVNLEDITECHNCGADLSVCYKCGAGAESF